MPSSVDAQATDAALRLRGAPLATSQDVAAYFGVSHSNLIWTLYRAPDDARYRHFEIPKRSGGMPPIHAPIGLLRELQDKLHLDLKALYRAHPHAHGFIDSRSVATNAADHTGKRWVLNIDLEDFFPTINFGRVRGLFLKPPFEMGTAAAAVCAQIATYRNGLPQGAPTSPVLSNFIAATLDRHLLRLARSNKLIYSRYADDITLSTSLQQFPPAIAIREQIAGGGYKILAGDALEQAIKASGFSINAKKVRIQGHGVQQSVTGLCVNTRVNVERARIRKIRAMLHAWKKFGLEAAGNEHFAKYRAAKGVRPGNPASAFRNIVYGHLSFVKMVRGPEDPVFLNLCAKVLELDPNPSKFIRQMIFGADDYEIFISHASEDKAEIARPIFEACQRAALKAFLDETHIGWGDSFTTKINTALGASRTVLAVITSNSVTKEWPLLEINTALALEASGSKRVIPLVVGTPDLSKLPLIRTKKWLTWDGDPEKVAAELKRLMMGADISAPEAAKPSVPIVPRTEETKSPEAGPSPSPAGPEKSGWLSRLWSRNWSR
jgi:RNA-directed DNA polymerase